MRSGNLALRACVLGALLVSGPARAQTAPEAGGQDLDAAIRKLSTAIERLAGAVEKAAASKSEDQESRRIDLAVSVLGLRTRRIERLESQIDSLGREEDESTGTVRFLRERIETVQKEGRTETGELSAEAKREIADVELGIRQLEEQSAKAAERKSALEADLAVERRRVTDLERLVEAWVGKLGT